jgi:hypothetical protein
MVLLTVTPAAKAALGVFLKTVKGDANNEDTAEQHKRLVNIEIGSPIEHHELVTISRNLVQHSGGTSRQWRLDTLLKGSTVYEPPPPPKPEPVG